MDYLDITKKYYDKILVENETLIQNRGLLFLIPLAVKLE